MVPVIAVSSAWETPAVGDPAPDFINAAALIRTTLSIEALKSQVIRKIEAQLGRIRTADETAPRPIDIDILVDDGRVMDPEIWSQAYLAVPVAELLPDLRDPNTGEPVSQAAECLACDVCITACPELTL
jgi:2-amino-4-hydroxy-6-hydroxymethyldihydropteridine diphosphokinase